MNKRFDTKIWEEFQVTAMDTGAQKSIISIKQAESYCRNVGIELNLSPDSATFVCGDGTCASVGRLKVIVPTPSGETSISVHVFRAKIRFLIGLYVLDKYHWNVLTVQNQLVSVAEKWRMHLVRKLGNVFLIWDCVFFCQIHS